MVRDIVSDDYRTMYDIYITWRIWNSTKNHVWYQYIGLIMINQLKHDVIVQIQLYKVAVNEKVLHYLLE